MAAIILQPVQQALNLVRGFQNTYKMVPRNPDGTVHDCTGINAVDMAVGQLNQAGITSGGLAVVVDSADATGVNCHIDASALESAIGEFGISNFNYSATISNGTDTGRATYGTITLQNVYLP